LLVYENATDKAMAKMMVDFITWAISDGQKFATELGYASLPDAVVMKEMSALGKIKVS
jgi:phosphate transport system substrate-binding protein